MHIIKLAQYFAQKYHISLAIESEESRGRMKQYTPNNHNHHKYDINLVHVTRLCNMMGYNIWTVDGNYIRSVIDIDFVAGGNPGVYAYVPKNEIWIENVYQLPDIVATLYHEIIECSLMKTNHLAYDVAHDLASEQEIKLRKKMQNQKLISFEELATLLNKTVKSVLNTSKQKS